MPSKRNQGRSFTSPQRKTFGDGKISEITKRELYANPRFARLFYMQHNALSAQLVELRREKQTDYVFWKTPSYRFVFVFANCDLKPKPWKNLLKLIFIRISSRSIQSRIIKLTHIDN